MTGASSNKADLGSSLAHVVSREPAGITAATLPHAREMARTNQPAKHGGFQVILSGPDIFPRVSVAAAHGHRVMAAGDGDQNSLLHSPPRTQQHNLGGFG